MAKDVFSVPVFLIVFRETLETVIIVSVLLAFLKQTLDGPNRDVKVYKKLRRQVRFFPLNSPRLINYTDPIHACHCDQPPPSPSHLEIEFSRKRAPTHLWICKRLTPCVRRFGSASAAASSSA